MASYTLVIGNKNYSSWSLRPWLAMRQFGVDFDEVRIPLDQADTAARLRNYSPSGKVPVLMHDDLSLWESLPILEYLAEQHPQQHWWPADARARAIARCISGEMHASFFGLRSEMPMNCRAVLPNRSMSDAVPREVERVQSLWQQCRQQFGPSGDFLFGPFTIADAMYAPVVLRFRTYCVALDPICRAYANAVLALPAMQEWLDVAQTERETIPAAER